MLCHMLIENKVIRTIPSRFVHQVSESGTDSADVAIPIPLIGPQARSDCRQYRSVNPFRCICLWSMDGGSNVVDTIFGKKLSKLFGRILDAVVGQNRFWRTEQMEHIAFEKFYYGATSGLTERVQ